MTPHGNDTLDILAFSPHPDDVEIGCAGTLLLAVKAGQTVGIADVTDGERATRGTPEIRRAETEEAARRLGIATRISLGLPDTRVADDEESLGKVVALLRKLRPRIVLLPYAEDRHPDHVATTALVRRAVFLAGVQKVYPEPAHRVGTLVHYMIHGPFTPSFVVDVSSVWDERCRVLEAYASQFEHGESTASPTALSHPSFLRSLDARAVHYGAMIGVAHGEAFWQPGPVFVRNLVDVAPLSATGGYRMFA